MAFWKLSIEKRTDDSFVIHSESMYGARLNVLLEEDKGIWAMEELTSSGKAWFCKLGRRRSWVKALAETLVFMEVELGRREQEELGGRKELIRQKEL